MSDTLNKKIFVDAIMNYLRDRLEINDTLRLRGKNDTLTVDDVYENYLEGVKRGYAKNKSFRNCFHSTRNGKKVVFSDSEKSEIYELVRNYLTQTSISDYPNIRGQECDFIVIILENVFKDWNNVPDETKLRVSKYIVALNALDVYFSFCNDIEGFIVKSDNEFYLEDHKGKKFINCTLGSTRLEEFTQVVLNEDVYVVTLLDRESQEEKVIFTASKKNNSSFSEYSDKYQVLSAQTLHHYLEENDCLFLERDLYDVEDLNSKLKDNVLKYINMSDEEKEKLDRLSDVATNWWTIALETVNFCSPKDIVRAMDSGYLNQFDFEIFEKEEDMFKKFLKEGIKALILSEPFVRIQSYNLNGDVFRRAFNKSDFKLTPMYLHLEKDKGKITYEDGDFKRVELVPDIMSGFEDIFSIHDLTTRPLYKEMDIVGGNIFVNNAKRDKVLIYSLKRDYSVLKRN